MNETTAASSTPEKSAEDIKLEESLKAFQKLTDPKARKAFYDAHPELQRVYSPVNFHAA